MAVKIQNQLGKIDISNDVIATVVGGAATEILELSAWQVKIKFGII